MLGTDLSTTKVLLVATLLGTTGLAGCVSGGGGSGLAYSSFDEAMSAPGNTYDANNTDSPIKLKTLTPANPDSGLSEGEQPVVVLLYDSSTNEPVTDASMSLEAHMPAMGHGTSPEEDPVHQDFGVYEGMTTWSMKGSWNLNIDAVLADGTVLEYDVHADVGSGDHGHNDGHDHGH